MNVPIRVLIADRQEIVRRGLSQLLGSEPGIVVAGRAASAREAVELAASAAPDVVLLDLLMPDLDGIESIRRLRQTCSTAQVLVLTILDDERNIQAAIEAGAIGYLLKDVLRDDLVRAVRAARQGQPCLHPVVQLRLMQGVRAASAARPAPRLTSRERGILELLGCGHSNKAIAWRLKLSEGTVKGHLSAIFDKLGVLDRTQAAVYAHRHGLASA